MNDKFDAAENTELRAIMTDLMQTLRKRKGGLNPPLAIPALLFTVGFVITISRSEKSDLAEVLMNCLLDILYAMSTADQTILRIDAAEMAERVINKARGEGLW